MDIDIPKYMDIHIFKDNHKFRFSPDLLKEVYWVVLYWKGAVPKRDHISTEAVAPLFRHFPIHVLVTTVDVLDIYKWSNMSNAFEYFSSD